MTERFSSTTRISCQALARIRGCRSAPAARSCRPCRRAMPMSRAPRARRCRGHSQRLAHVEIRSCPRSRCPARAFGDDRSPRRSMLLARANAVAACGDLRRAGALPGRAVDRPASGCSARRPASRSLRRRDLDADRHRRRRRPSGPSRSASILRPTQQAGEARHAPSRRGQGRVTSCTPLGDSAPGSRGSSTRIRTGARWSDDFAGVVVARHEQHAAVLRRAGRVARA